MSHCADGRNAVIALVNGAGSGVEASDISGSCAVYCAVIALRPARAELHDAAVSCGALYSVGLCCNKTLMINGKKHHCFNKLSLNHGTADGDYGLTRKNYRTLRYCPDVAAEFKIRKIGKEVLIEPFFAQHFNILLSEAEVFKIIYELAQTGHDCKAAVIGYLAEKHIEPGNLIADSVAEIAVCH